MTDLKAWDNVSDDVKKLNPEFYGVHGVGEALAKNPIYAPLINEGLNSGVVIPTINQNAPQVHETPQIEDATESLISLVIYVTPKSVQHGARACVVKGKLRFFSDKSKSDYQKAISEAAQTFAPKVPFDGAVSLFARFILPRPQTMKEHPGNIIKMYKRPDYDNLAKGTQDGLSRCGFWKDDGQIWEAHIQKFWSEIGGEPRICIRINGE